MSGEQVLYGVRAGTVDEVAAALAARLGFTFQERDSYFVGIYFRARTEQDEVQVLPRLDPEGDPTEEKFKEYEVLIYSTVDISGIPTGAGEVERLR